MTDILVIEDEPTIADSLRLALTREGFGVETMGTAGAGIEALAAGGFDLVILDVGLPDMSGFEACRTIRRDSDVPVIFLTARGDEIDRVVGLEIGADDYVVKPFSVRELVARVQVILRRRVKRPGKEAGETLVDSGQAAESLHGLVHDHEGARILVHGQPLDLARYEYLLLGLLLERPGRVWSRADIMTRLWPERSGSLERTVDAHVKTLRAKLREAGIGAEVIRTHRGFGYSLVKASAGDA